MVTRTPTTFSRHREVIYESSQPHFFIDRFFLQLLIHLGFPFFIWLSPNWYRQGFISSHPVAIWLNWVCPSLIIVMIICLYSSPDFAQGNGLAIILPIGFYVTHRIMISLKYASLTESEYAKVMRCYDDKIGPDYTAQLQLVSGLLGQHPAVLDFEIAAAATRMAIKRFSEHFITIDCNKKHQTSIGADRADWLSFIREALVPETAPSVHDICGPSMHSQQPTQTQGVGRRTTAFATAGRNKGIVRELQLSINSVSSGEQNKSFLFAGGNINADVNVDVNADADADADVGTGADDTVSAGNNVEEIPISVVMAALIHRASRAANPLSLAFSALCAVGLVVCTACPLLKANASKQVLSTNSIIFLASTTIILALFYSVTVMFLVTAIFSMNRQWALATELTDMIDQSAANILEAEATGEFSREQELLEHIGRETCRFVGSSDGSDNAGVGAGVSASASKFDTPTSTANVVAEADDAYSGGISDTSVVHSSSSFPSPSPSPSEIDAVLNFQASSTSDWAPHLSARNNNIGARAHTQDRRLIPRPPLLMLNSVNNVVSFMHIRLILRDYGLRFQFRLDAYVGTLMQFTVVLMLAVIVKLATHSGPIDPLSDALLIQVLVLITIGSVFMFVLVLLGARVNDIYVRHQMFLTTHVLQCEKRIADLMRERSRLVALVMASAAATTTSSTSTDDTTWMDQQKTKAQRDKKLEEVRCEIQDQQQLLHALGTAGGIMQTSHTLKPLKVLNIPATYPLAYSIFSAMLSFAVFIYSTMPGSHPMS